MCGIFGLACYGKKIEKINEIISALAEESTERGIDATGIAYNIRNHLHIYKKAVSAYKMKFNVPDGVLSVVGHTRHATQGSKNKIINNHPFPGRIKGMNFALVHNGVLTNDVALRNQYKLPKTNIETDSYVAVQLIENKRTLDFDSLKFMAENVNGSFSFAVLDDRNNTYLVKGDSPLSILHFKDLNLYAYASTDNILWRAIIESPLFKTLKHGNFEEVKITEGDILKITSSGKLIYDKFDYRERINIDCDWRSYGNYLGRNSYFDNDFDIDASYLDELKTVANFYGYTEEQVEELYNDGFTPEEIEAFLYEGVMMEM